MCNEEEFPDSTVFTLEPLPRLDSFYIWNGLLLTFQWLKKYVTVVCLPGNRELNIRLGINSKKENPRSCSLIPDGWIIPTLIYICSIPSLRCMIFCSTLGGMALLLDLGHTYNSSCRVNFA